MHTGGCAKNNEGNYVYESEDTLVLAQPRSAPRSHLLLLKTCQPRRRLQRHRLSVMAATGALFATIVVSPLRLASFAILVALTLAV